MYSLSARFSSSFASTSRWLVGSSRSRTFASPVYQACTDAPSPAHHRLRHAPGSRYVWWSVRISQGLNAPHTGYKTEIPARFPRYRSCRIVAVYFLLKIADFQIITLFAASAEVAGSVQEYSLKAWFFRFRLLRPVQSSVHAP